MKNIAVYPGTFDPITNGHIDIIKRGARVFDEVIVAVAFNPQKEPLFEIEERVEIIREVTGDIPSVSVESFSGLLIDYLEKHQAQVILRGLRAISDFEYEFQMASMNRKLASKFETIFMMTGEQYSYLSSSFVKEICRLGGKVDCFVPDKVNTALIEKYSK
ncbi:MAG: pantetheine-phosphate adenylyltransferase [Proteobacteria bacterium]|nr:pantetheine-phosphate adenylyltransferase [Pseudomonadota bacterium]